MSALPTSTTGSLSSIITTSVASSEPDPGSDRGGDGGDEKLTLRNGVVIKEEEWWKTTLQVSIPFFIAGIGTIGAGVILGRVEVSIINFFFFFNLINIIKRHNFKVPT